MDAWRVHYTAFQPGQDPGTDLPGNYVMHVAAHSREEAIYMVCDTLFDEDSTPYDFHEVYIQRDDRYELVPSAREVSAVVR